VLLAGGAACLAGSAQAQPSRLVIGALVNEAEGAILDLQGGECEVASSDGSMTCEFQQVFLTPAPADAQTCLVTTNRYARTFQKSGDRTWTSRDEPTGPCGMVDEAILIDEGDQRRWRLEQRKIITRRDTAACQTTSPPPEVLSWRRARRALPCRFIQPGALR